MIADHGLLSGPHEGMRLERARQRQENDLLRQERDLLKKATALVVREIRRCSAHFSLRRRPPRLRHACALAQVFASDVMVMQDHIIAQKVTVINPCRADHLANRLTNGRCG